MQRLYSLTTRGTAIWGTSLSPSTGAAGSLFSLTRFDSATTNITGRCISSGVIKNGSDESQSVAANTNSESSPSMKTSDDNRSKSGNKRPRKKRLPDSPYVLRRAEYLEKVGRLRAKFLEKIKKERAEKELREREKYQSRFIVDKERVEQKRYVPCYVLSSKFLLDFPRVYFTDALT